MTRKQAQSIMLTRQANAYRLACTHNKFRFTTGLFVAPVPLHATGGAFVVATRKANVIVVHMLGAEQSFRIVDHGRLSKESFGCADGYWYMVDKSSISKDSPLFGYSGFCFIGSAEADVGVEYGFIPFGETEVMLDANGEKFLVWRGE